MRLKTNALAFLFSLFVVSALSFFSSRGNIVANSFLSEQLQPKHYELYVYVLMTLQGSAMATATRSWPLLSKMFAGLVGFLLPFYVGIVGALLGWGFGAILASWPNAPISALAMLALFVLMSSIVLVGAYSTDLVIKKITEFTARQRKHEGFVRLLGMLMAIYGAVFIFMYLNV